MVVRIAGARVSRRDELKMPADEGSNGHMSTRMRLSGGFAAPITSTLSAEGRDALTDRYLSRSASSSAG